MSCLKELESSVDFQQRIINNQQRLQNFESSTSSELKSSSSNTNVPVKEEPLQVEALDIKTECFQFEPAAVVQSWQEAMSIRDDELQESSAFNPCDRSEDSDSYLLEEPPLPDQTIVNVYHGENADVPSHMDTASTKPIRNSEGKFECKFCSTSLKSKKSLKVHMKSIHMGIKRFECKNCSKMFYHKAGMIYHTQQNVCKKERKYAKKKILIKEESM